MLFNRRMLNTFLSLSFILFFLLGHPFPFSSLCMLRLPSVLLSWILFDFHLHFLWAHTTCKVSKYRVSSAPYFTAFLLNIEFKYCIWTLFTQCQLRSLFLGFDFHFLQAQLSLQLLYCCLALFWCWTFTCLYTSISCSSSSTPTSLECVLNLLLIFSPCVSFVFKFLTWLTDSFFYKCCCSILDLKLVVVWNFHWVICLVSDYYVILLHLHVKSGDMALRHFRVVFCSYC